MIAGLPDDSWSAPGATGAAPPMPAVGILTNSLSRAAGGLFFALRDAAGMLERRGMPPGIFALRDAHFAADRAAWTAAHVQVFDGVGPASFRMSPALVRALVAARLDVLHLHGLWNFPSLAAWLWRRRTGRPLVISPHGMLDPGALAFSPGKKRLAGMLYERRNLGQASAIHALNQAEADAVRAFGLVAPIAVIPNGVDLPAASLLDRRDWSADTRRTLLFLARIHPKKGVQELIAAWRAMLDQAPSIGPRWRLRIVGWDDGGLMEAARRQIAELALSGHVELPGPLFGSDKDAAYADAHAFILPSRSEGLPISVLEAWSFGLPVFMTDACNLPIGFAQGAAVRIVAEPGPLAATLAETLSGGDARLRQMGQAGRRLARDTFGWEQVVDRQIALYRWLARGGATPDFVQHAPDAVR